MPESKRVSVSKSLRFEVFKRDSFTCQYCGRKAPDVILNADHIDPVANGGPTTILNLITACKDCNAGKSDRKLRDSQMLDKQRDQLSELQERREQIDLMLQWQQELANLKEDTFTRLEHLWLERVGGYTLNETGIKILRDLVRRYDPADVATAIRDSTDQYLVHEGQVPTRESVEKAFNMLGAICKVLKLERRYPNIRRLYMMRGIIRKRFSYCNEPLALEMLQSASDAGAHLDDLEHICRTAGTWSRWKSEIEGYYL